MQPIDWKELVYNREKLISWQQEQRNRKIEGLRLNLGSGTACIPGYTNVDLYASNADYKEDIRKMYFETNGVTEIVAQHVLEHLPYKDVYPTLKHWYNILAPGGTVEIGMPDFELCTQLYLETPIRDRFKKYIWAIFGEQTNPGMVHMGGFSLGEIIRFLESAGFRMVDAYSYDGYGIPCLFAYAVKPSDNPRVLSVLERDVVIGTFTNSTSYIKDLWKSANKYLPHIPFITRIQRASIVEGALALHDDFIESGKRYCVFLDDDIQFLNSDIIKNALDLMVKEKYGIVSVYSTFNKSVLESKYSPEEKGLIPRDHNFAVGYFILFDIKKIGYILPDIRLPDPNLAVDADFSVAARAAGYKIGISADYVYHAQKDTHPGNPNSQPTIDYLAKKYGKYYFDYTQYGGSVIEWGLQEGKYT